MDFGKSHILDHVSALPNPVLSGLKSTAQWMGSERKRRLATEYTVRLDLAAINQHSPLKKYEESSLIIETRSVLSARINLIPETSPRDYLVQISGIFEWPFAAAFEQELKISETSGKTVLPFRLLCAGRRLTSTPWSYSGCDRRVYSLFLVPRRDRNFFACRYCHDLTYLSRQAARKRSPRPHPRSPSPPSPSSAPPAVFLPANLPFTPYSGHPLAQ